MSELKSYVNSLFSKYDKSKYIDDLKSEILSNLEAKKADLVASGLDEQVAFEKAKDSITSIDDLIDGNKKIYINRYRLESLQQSLLYLVIAWIATIPLMIVGNFLNLWLLLSLIVIGVIFLCNKSNKSESYIKEERYVNIRHYIKVKRTVWIIWGIFVAICFLAVTGLYFGSNMWFGRPIKINGPYAFALMMSRYLSPLITVIIPLIINMFQKYILKNEVDCNEK